MSIPFSDPAFTLFNGFCDKKKPKVNPLPQEKLYQSTSTVTSSSYRNDNKNTMTTPDQYDLSYYFEPCTTSNANEENVAFRGRSLSIGSTLSSHFISTPSSTTVSSQPHGKSHKKALHHFFGEHIEVTAKEVRKEGLKALLVSSAPLGYFLYHLLNEYSSENLVRF